MKALFLVAVVGCGGANSNKPDAGASSGESPKKTHPTEVVTVKTEDLAKEYEADKAAAEAKYAGKLVEISGPVRSASLDNAAEAPLVLLTGNPAKPTSLIQCLFPAAAAEKVLALAEGQSVRIQGVIEKGSFGFGVPLLECELAESGPSPAVTTTATEMTQAAADDLPAADKKYTDKPVILTGVVDKIKKEGTAFTFILKGHDPKATVTAGFGVPISSKVKAALEAVKPGDTLKMKGLAGVYADGYFVNSATLLK